MKTLSTFLVSCLVAVAAQAQTVLLDNFNSGTATGAVITGTSWVGNVVQNPNTITVFGGANDDNGWGTTSVNVSASGMLYLTITAQRESGNAASTLAIQFEDGALNTDVLTVSTSSFSIGSMSTVSILLNWVNIPDPSAITGWNIGGGGNTSTGPDFAMSFDNMAFTATAAVPEPSTYAAILGALALGLVAWRRRQATA